ncbi:hypothetical protein QYM36_014159, partial [Artemia franciscana]
VIKFDLQKKEVQTFSEEGKSVSEPVFVVRPNSVDEDDGVVLFSILDDEHPQKVSLVLLDGKSFKELGRADFDANGTVPNDFHGLFIAKKDQVHLY